MLIRLSHLLCLIRKNCKHLSVPYFEGFCFPLGNEVEISQPLRLKKQWSTQWLLQGSTRWLFPRHCVKLPELPLLDELRRAVTSAKIPAARLNQDGRRAAALCSKAGRIRLRRGWMGAQSSTTKWDPAGTEKKKATANLPKLGDSDARLFLRKRRPGNRREPFTIHPSRRAAIASRLKGRCVGEVKMSTWEGPSLPAHFRFLSFQQLEARLMQDTCLIMWTDLISLWVEQQFHYDELWIHMANAAAPKQMGGMEHNICCKKLRRDIQFVDFSS